VRYLMRQKIWAWGDDFVIRDADDNDIFFVDGKAFSLGKQLSFQDMDGTELAYIKQKLLSWGPSYHLYRSGELYAEIKKKLFTFFRDKLTVDIPGPNDLEVSGSFLDHEYAFTRHGEQVAQVSKAWFSWSDTYGVDIAHGEDDVLILATTVIIDLVCHDNDD